MAVKTNQLFRLPAQYVRKSTRNALRYRKREKVRLHRLPFINAEANGGTTHYWSVPKTGGYFGGIETGRALAYIYLKHLKEHGPGLPILQRMVLDMFGCGGSENEEVESLRGQAVGFFIALEYCLLDAVNVFGNMLDQLKDRELLEVANAGLNFDNAAYMAAPAENQKV